MTLLQIIPRAAWGARHKRGFGPAPLPALGAYLHQSVSLMPDLEWIDVDGDGVEDEEARAMLRLEDIGQERFGGGISYTWAIAPSGRIYEGHGEDRQGAHTIGLNDTTRGVVLMGRYQDTDPTPMQIRSCAWLLQDAHRRGVLRRPVLLGGHRDVKATECPGGRAYAAISRTNALAAGPPITDTPKLEEDRNMLAYPVTLSPTTGDQVTETVVPLPWKEGGVTGAARVYAVITNANAELRVAVAHWQCKAADGTHYIEEMIPNGSVVQPRDAVSKQAPSRAYALVIDHSSPLGGTVLVEASR